VLLGIQLHPKTSDSTTLLHSMFCPGFRNWVFFGHVVSKHQNLD